jgi:hypothetical protein
MNKFLKYICISKIIYILNEKQCGVTQGVAGSLVGRGVNRRQQSQCHECCSMDKCNKNLCYHLTRNMFSPKQIILMNQLTLKQVIKNILPYISTKFSIT